MQLLFHWRWLLVMLLWLSLRPAAQASHIRGGDIAYTSVPMPFHNQVPFQAATGGQLVFIVDELGHTVGQLRAGTDGRVWWQPAASLPAGLYRARGGRPPAGPPAARRELNVCTLTKKARSAVQNGPFLLL